MPRGRPRLRRPLADKEQFYVYVWTYKTKIIWVGLGHDIRGVPSARNHTGRPKILCDLLEKYWNKIEYKVHSCSSRDEAKLLEVKLTRKLKPKYNSVLGFAGFTGKTHSQETKEKISKKSTGRPLSPLGRKLASERMSERNKSNPPRKGVPCSEEHRRKLSEAAKRRHSRAS